MVVGFRESKALKEYKHGGDAKWEYPSILAALKRFKIYTHPV